MSRVVIVGGGAAGFFAAVTCAEMRPDLEVHVLEKGPEFLSKVRISGGGRCNVTHACFEPRDLVQHYPRGGKELLGPLHAFQPRHTVDWFASRGVSLKTESDGRMFPVTDRSQTIIDCLLRAAETAQVHLKLRSEVESVTRCEDGYSVKLKGGEALLYERVMLATGGCRAAANAHLASGFGHSIEPPVPSLFAFDIAEQWVRELAGVSLPDVEVSLGSAGLRQRGPALITHRGMSGPAVLKASAWGARELFNAGYRTAVAINWAPSLKAEQLEDEFRNIRNKNAARFVVNTPAAGLPARLWEALVLNSGVPRETRIAELSRAAQHRLMQQMLGTELHMTGKSLNKDEFVTCGGVRNSEVNFKTMESKLCPGLHFGGELLDIDGVTGGFNFQAAWTTGWLAGRAMASACRQGPCSLLP